MNQRIVRAVRTAVGLVAISAFALACNSNPLSPEPGTLVRTSAMYEIPQTTQTYTVTFTLTNTFSDPVYYSARGPIIEKLVDGQWVFGYSRGAETLQAQRPIELAPGETRDLAVPLAVRISVGSDAGFLHGIEGTYRANYGFKLGPLKDNWPDGRGFLASSNQFDIRLNASE